MFCFKDGEEQKKSYCLKKKSKTLHKYMLIENKNLIVKMSVPGKRENLESIATFNIILEVVIFPLKFWILQDKN